MVRFRFFLNLRRVSIEINKWRWLRTIEIPQIIHHPLTSSALIVRTILSRPVINSSRSFSPILRPTKLISISTPGSNPDRRIRPFVPSGDDTVTNMLQIYTKYVQLTLRGLNGIITRIFQTKQNTELILKRQRIYGWIRTVLRFGPPTQLKIGELSSVNIKKNYGRPYLLCGGM